MDILPVPSSDEEPLPAPATAEMFLTPEKNNLPPAMKAKKSKDNQKKAALKDSVVAKTNAAKKKLPQAGETVPKQDVEKHEDANPNEVDSATDDGTTASAKPKAKASRKRKAPPVSDEERAHRLALAVEYVEKSTTIPAVDDTYRIFSGRRLKELAIDLPDQKRIHMLICSLEWKKKPTTS